MEIKTLEKVLFIFGPNVLNFNKRPQQHYGMTNYAHTERLTSFDTLWNELNNNIAYDFYIELKDLCSEGDIIATLQDAYQKYDAIIVNLGGYTHTSVAIHDCLEYRPIPVISVHQSNIYAREDFRKTDLIAPVTDLQISGAGETVYILALQAVKHLIARQKFFKNER